jgi:hypothetical protein
MVIVRLNQVDVLHFFSQKIETGNFTFQCILTTRGGISLQLILDSRT